MKKIKAICLISCLLFAANSSHAQNDSGWKEIEAFHNLVSKAFHTGETGNLKPARDSANIILEKAKQWQPSAVPADYKEQETKKSLQQLVDD